MRNFTQRFENAIIHKPLKLFQPNLKLTTYIDILSCIKSLKQIHMTIQFFRMGFKNLAQIIYH